jgi:hypothetical protein
VDVHTQYKEQRDSPAAVAIVVSGHEPVTVEAFHIRTSSMNAIQVTFDPLCDVITTGLTLVMCLIKGVQDLGRTVACSPLPL